MALHIGDTVAVLSPVIISIDAYPSNAILHDRATATIIGKGKDKDHVQLLWDTGTHQPDMPINRLELLSPVSISQ